MRKIISLVICLMLFVPAIPGGFAADGGFNRNLSLDEINFLEFWRRQMFSPETRNSQ